MEKQEAKDKAIERVKGQDVAAGTIVASRLDPKTWEFLRYDGDDAVCRIGEDERRFPRSEIFDVKKVINVANRYLNIGFWEEGMGSMILTIGENKEGK